MVDRMYCHVNHVLTERLIRCDRGLMRKDTRRYPNGIVRRPSQPAMKVETKKLTRAEQLRAVIATRPPGVVVIEINNTVPLVKK